MKNVFNMNRVAYNTRVILKSDRLSVVKSKDFFTSTLIRATKSRYTLCGDGCSFLGYAVLDGRKAVTRVGDILDSQVLNTEGVQDMYIMVWGKMSDLSRLMVIDEEVYGSIGYIENDESNGSNSNGSGSSDSTSPFIYDGGQVASYDYIPGVDVDADYVYDGGNI